MKLGSRELLLLTCSIAFGLLACLGIDRRVGRFWPELTVRGELIFRPGSKAVYDTQEFRITVLATRLGFRDCEFRAPRSGRFRVLAIGDSFTLGWGVDLEDSWPKLLEQKLIQSGRAVEIANLGQGGAFPQMYADLAEKAVPMLKPDLALVAVLQGDDFAQSVPSATAAAPSSSRRTSAHTRLPDMRSVVARTLRMIYPNLVLLARSVIPAPEQIDIIVTIMRS